MFEEIHSFIILLGFRTQGNHRLSYRGQGLHGFHLNRSLRSRFLVAHEQHSRTGADQHDRSTGGRNDPVYLLFRFCIGSTHCFGRLFLFGGRLGFLRLGRRRLRCLCQCFGQFCNALGSDLWLDFQRLFQSPFLCGRKFYTQGGRSLQTGFAILPFRRIRRDDTSDTIIDGGRQCVHIGAGIAALSHVLFHRCETLLNHNGHGLVTDIGPGCTKVDELQSTIWQENNVIGGDVTMNNTTLMHLFHVCHQRLQLGKELLGREFSVSLHILFQRQTIQILHYQIGRIIGFKIIQNLYNTAKI